MRRPLPFFWRRKWRVQGISWVLVQGISWGRISRPHAAGGGALAAASLTILCTCPPTRGWGRARRCGRNGSEEDPGGAGEGIVSSRLCTSLGVHRGTEQPGQPPFRYRGHPVDTPPPPPPSAPGPHPVFFSRHLDHSAPRAKPHTFQPESRHPTPVLCTQPLPIPLCLSGEPPSLNPTP